MVSNAINQKELIWYIQIFIKLKCVYHADNTFYNLLKSILSFVLYYIKRHSLLQWNKSKTNAKTVSITWV